MEYFADDIIDELGKVEGVYLYLEGKKYRIVSAENHGLHVIEVKERSVVNAE